MIQQKTFKLGDDKAINAFLTEHPPFESTGIKYLGESVIVVYEDESGFNQNYRQNKIRMKIASIEEQLIDAEADFRTWSATLLFVPGNQTFEAKVRETKQVKEGLQIQLKVLTNMLNEDPTKKEEEIPAFAGKKDYSGRTGKKEAAKAAKKAKK